MLSSNVTSSTPEGSVWSLLVGSPMSLLFATTSMHDMLQIWVFENEYILQHSQDKPVEHFSDASSLGSDLRNKRRDELLVLVNSFKSELNIISTVVSLLTHLSWRHSANSSQPNHTHTITSVLSEENLVSPSRTHCRYTNLGLQRLAKVIDYVDASYYKTPMYEHTVKLN